MTILHPCDDLSAEELTVKLLNNAGPSYMRTARNKTSRIYDGDSATNLEIGKGSIIIEGSDVAIISCGVMVERSIEAARILEDEGISCSVIDMHTIKPLDMELLTDLAENVVA